MTAARPLFIATRRFDPAESEKWRGYCEWAKIPKLVEIVSLDSLLCEHLIRELSYEDWAHNVHENFRLDYFYDFDYLMQRVRDLPRKNILGVYRNPENHSIPAPAENFEFVGYDLIEEQTQISALTNCGGFPDVFRNDELNCFGLIADFNRAADVRRLLTERHPEEHHAQCEMYAIWRLNEGAYPERR